MVPLSDEKVKAEVGRIPFNGLNPRLSTVRDHQGNVTPTEVCTSSCKDIIDHIDALPPM